MSDFDLVITGRVVRTDRVIDNGYVAIRDGRIARVGEGPPPQARERHDFGQAYVMPGAIDSQVHSRSQKDQEDFIWSTRSAAAGGVTTIVDMPYDAGFLVCTGERVKQKIAEAGAQTRVDFALYATIDPDDGANTHCRHGGGGRGGVQILHLLHRSEAFSAHPAADAICVLPAIGAHGLMAGVHNENDEMVRAAIKAVEAIPASVIIAPMRCRVRRSARRWPWPKSTRSARRPAAPRMSCIARSGAAMICARPIAARASTGRSRPASIILSSTRRMT